MPDLIKEFGTLAGFKASQDARLSSLPKTPEDYKLALPEDFKVPDGYVVDDKDPRLPALRALAKEAGWDQPTFSKVVAAEAAHRIAEDKRVADAQAAEIAKLGANGTARVTAVKTALAGIVGNDRASAMINRFVLADDIAAIEDVLRAISSQGAHGPNGSERAPPAPPPKTLAERMYPKLPSATRI